MTTDRIPVVPAVITWARESAGFDVATAAKRLVVSEATVLKWEAGELQPTIKQLRKVSKLYRRPLAVLLLPTPPKDFRPVQDFRTMPSEGGRAWSPGLIAEFKRAVTQRDVALELAELGAWPGPQGTLDIQPDQDVEKIGAAVRTLLGLDAWPAGLWGQPSDLLNVFIGAVESQGILVIHTSRVEISEARGFSISDLPYPVIALNGADWPRPRIFTLLHELAHLVLRGGGLCDLHDRPRGTATAADKTEHRCNEIAAATLMPKDRFLASPLVKTKPDGHEWTLDELQRLSHQFGASSEAVLLRLVALGRASWDLYQRRRVELVVEYDNAKAQEKARQKAAKGGPSPYRLKARNLGHGYIGTVLDAYDRRVISSLDVVDYLDVSYDKLPKLEEMLRR